MSDQSSKLLSFHTLEPTEDVQSYFSFSGLLPVVFLPWETVS